MSRTPAIVVICMPERGHLQRLLPLVAGLSARGRTVHVATHRDFAPEVARSGGVFHDLFARHPIAAADAASIPVPSRYVSFAAAFAEPLTDVVAALAPGLVVYDTFAVVAPVIARRLGVPYVNVCAGHAAVPARAVARLREDQRVSTAPECHAAVRRLRDVHGVANASPFSYLDNLSPTLNVYGEPPEFLDPADAAALAPLAYFGSLAPAQRDTDSTGTPFTTAEGTRTYVSFGTVVWRYFAPAAEAALTAIAAVAAEGGGETVIGLGGHALAGDAPARLEHPHVRVLPWVDQWAALRDADVFVTHHGLNSTHESIFHETRMISYPFFGDQPELAARCQDLGLAVPLATAPRAPVTYAEVRRAFQRVHDGRDALALRLRAARTWELATIARRDAVLDRIVALARGG